jgi:transcriptional regulator with XRE-family HTH domain
MRRILMGLSQEKLGEALDLTFQQVQKYEKGTNRIGASRLQQIAQILNVPPGFFFDGAPAVEGQPVSEPATGEFAEEEEGSSYIVDFLSTAEGVRLNKAFARIRNPKIRRRIIDLVTSLSDGEDPENGMEDESPKA